MGYICRTAAAMAKDAAQPVTAERSESVTGEGGGRTAGKQPENMRKNVRKTRGKCLHFPLFFAMIIICDMLNPCSRN